jgi:hypothetical protein
MALLRGLLLSGLILGLVGTTDAADGAKKKKKKSGVVTGVVKEVQASSDGGTLLLQPKGKKKNATPAGEARKITLHKETRVEKLTAPLAKGQRRNLPPGQAAQVSDIAVKSRVAVVLKSGTDNVADRVVILPRKKKADQ